MILFLLAIFFLFLASIGLGLYIARHKWRPAEPDPAAATAAESGE